MSKTLEDNIAEAIRDCVDRSRDGVLDSFSEARHIIDKIGLPVSDTARIARRLIDAGLNAGLNIEMRTRET